MNGIKCCVAMRGRNPDHPTRRVAGDYLEQKLEVQKGKWCNALTTVQKDNFVLEIRAVGVRKEKAKSVRAARGKIRMERHEMCYNEE